MSVRKKMRNEHSSSVDFVEWINRIGKNFLPFQAFR